MITANQARKESVLHQRGQELIEEIEGYIVRATKNGKFSVTVNHELVMCDENIELVKAVYDEFSELGFKFDWKYAEPLPDGCRSDQWNYRNGVFKVEW